MEAVVEVAAASAVVEVAAAVAVEEEVFGQEVAAAAVEEVGVADGVKRKAE